MNNRQAGRRGRGRGGQRQPGSGGGNPRDNGNRIDNRARGNAAQLLEKYKNLAADAQRAGDRVNTEYYLQFADHYFRVLGDSRPRVEESRRNSNEFDGDDEDFDLDGDQGSDNGAQDRGQRDDRANRDDRGQREERGQRDDRGNRDDRPQRDDRGPREDRQPRAQREDRPVRDDRAPREDRQPREERQPREDRVARDDRAPREERQPRIRRDGRSNPANDAGEVRAVEGEVGTQQAEAAPATADVAEAKPRRTRTPRVRAEVAAEPAETEVAPSIEADRLPPSLSQSANDDGAERPRRRRRVRADEEVVPPAA